MAALLAIAGLTRRFGGVTAVDALDLAVAEGELVSIIGPNGAGKTTVFNLVTGLEFARLPAAWPSPAATSPVLRPSELAALGFARTFQHGRVFGNLSVLDNVLVGAHTRLSGGAAAMAADRPARRSLRSRSRGRRPCKPRRQRLRAEAMEILALFGDRLLPRADNPAFSLSYANRRRLEIARALALQPRVLLLDEPTAGMNPTETAEMLGIIRALKGPAHHPADRAQARPGHAAVRPRRRHG